MQACAGRERREQSDSCLVELTGVIGVRVQHGRSEGHLAAVQTDELPVQIRGELKRQVKQRGFAVVAHRDQGPDGEMAFCGPEADIKVEIRIGQGRALCVLRSGLRGSLWGSRHCGLRCLLRICAGNFSSGRRTIDGLTVFVDGALQNDFALLRLVFLRLLDGLGGNGRCAGRGLGVGRESERHRQACDKPQSGAGCGENRRLHAAFLQLDPNLFLHSIKSPAL